jgi:hypothetical protein
MDPAIFGLFKGSGTLFGAKTMTQSSSCLPKPDSLRFQVGLGWAWVRFFFAENLPKPNPQPIVRLKSVVKPFAE